MSTTMELTGQHLEQVGSYVREHLNSWIRDISLPTPAAQLDPVLLERIVRVEEELKLQRELMTQGFEQVDKRFEEARVDANARFAQVDKRFEQVDRRFEEVRADANARFEQMDRRFEQMRLDANARFDDTRAHTNTRFEQVDKRFEELRADTLAGFEAARKQTSHSTTLISVILGLMTVAVTVTNLL